MPSQACLRLLLGDQLSAQHSWFEQVDDQVWYVLMEIRPESEYVQHHIQKILGIFAAMRAFASELEAVGHQVIYFKIDDSDNAHSFEANLNTLIERHEIQRFEYQDPDEYRLDQLLKSYCNACSIETTCVSSEHFYTSRLELKTFFEGKKSIIMENFYRHMRKKHQVLMDGQQPVGGKWNYDKANRKKLPRKHEVPKAFVFEHDVTPIFEAIQTSELPYIGKVDPQRFIWPINREEALTVLNDFVHRLLYNFGVYQDAMHQDYWSLYHSRLSFALNVKLLHPKEVIEAVEDAYYEQDEVDIAQVEGFIRQILGWREFMRGIYWQEMPKYNQLNALEAKRTLPKFFWTADTKMNCLNKAIGQSLDHAYAHHIQRLMITGNFCLLAGIKPSEVDRWYLGIYIDAFEWVEITNTRGMSQFADGGIVATKPYCSSANYIDKMSNYCQHCHYNKKEKTGAQACPFNSLYWNFIDQHKDSLQNNSRMSMIYRVWDKFSANDKELILEQADKYLTNIEQL